jgi:hypothetical protein
MTEAEALKTAQALVTAGRKKEALPLLWTLCDSADLNVKLQAGLALVASLDRLTESDKLLKVVDDILPVASALGDADVHTYLLGKKAEFLSNRLSSLIFQQRSLNLASAVFEWIDFSLEEDKAEFAKIAAQRTALEKEIFSLEKQVLRAVKTGDNHYMRGHTFSALGEVFFSRYLDSSLDHAPRRRLKTIITNLYLIRRWHLDKLIGYSRKDRQQLRSLWNNCVAFYRKAIGEFQAINDRADVAFAEYGLSVKFAITFRFRLARRLLRQAKELARSTKEASLLASIDELEKQVMDKNKHPRNYVREFGLDLPRRLRG